MKLRRLRPSRLREPGKCGCGLGKLCDVEWNGDGRAGLHAGIGYADLGDGDASAKNFTIGIIDDAALESNETINVTLSNPLGGDAGFAVDIDGDDPR